MTDQTRWGIDLVQQENKDKKYQSEQKLKARILAAVSRCVPDVALWLGVGLFLQD